MMSSEKLRTSLLFTNSTHPLQKREYPLRYRDMQVLTIFFKSHFIIDFQLNTFFPSQFCVFTVKIPTVTQRSAEEYAFKKSKNPFRKTMCSNHGHKPLTAVEWVHCLFLFPLVLGKM